MTRPRIGMTLDWEKTGSFAETPYYACRDNYVRAITLAGGVPVLIPHEMGCIEEILDVCDGIMMTGGGYAFPQEWYIAEDETPPYEATPRADFDIAVAQSVIERGIPMLGICAGMQILAGVTGCKLTRNVHTTYKTTHDHLRGTPATAYDHEVHIELDSLLHQVVGLPSMKVNSHHCEGVVTIPDESVRVCATAPDGVIEAIELTRQPFVIGVQWHPEYFTKDAGARLFKALVQASRS